MAKPRGERLIAHLVYDGDDSRFHIPETLGSAEQQPIVGSPLEQLSEFVAFLSESLDSGDEFIHIHRALIERGLRNPYRHAVFGVVVTAGTADEAWKWAGMLFGEPDYWGRVVGTDLRITTNLRAMIRGFGDSPIRDTQVPMALAVVATALAPQFPWSETGIAHIVERLPQEATHDRGTAMKAEHPGERWVTVYVQAGMRLLAEVGGSLQVGVMARRTAKFDDSGMPWIINPLLKEYLKACESQHGEVFAALDAHIQDFAAGSQRLYDEIVSHLEAYSRSDVQARVSASGFLGQCVRSEAVITTTVAEWQRLLRVNGDFRVPAEARHLFVGKREGEPSIFDALIRSRYRESFLGAQPRLSPDGVGRVIDVPGLWNR